jgi:inositol-hexakisphosphate 5-kinase
MSNPAPVPNNTSATAQVTHIQGANHGPGAGEQQPPYNSLHPPSDGAQPKPLALTGRARTAPLQPLDTLWTTTVDAPQLSERDSIFATTYLPSNTPPPSPSGITLAVRAKDAYQESSALHKAAGTRSGQLTGTTRTTPYFPHRTPPQPIPISPRNPPPPTPAYPRYTTYRSPTATKSQDDPQQIIRKHYNIKPAEGMGDTILHHGLLPGMSPVDSPFDRPSSPNSRSTSSPSLIKSDVDEEERFRYRSWREGKASIDGHLLTGKSHHRTVDINTHVDKKIQATLPKVDPPVTAARSRKASQYLGLFRENDAAEEHKRRQERSRDHAVREIEGPRGGPSIPLTESIAVVKEDEEVQSTKVQSPIPWSRSQPDLYRHAKIAEKAPSPFFREVNHRLNQIPPHDLLARNLPGAPQDAAPRPKFQRGRSRTEQLLQGDRPGQHSPEEGEESEREQIKSALYFPHRQVLPDATPLSRKDSGTKQKPSNEMPSETVAREAIAGEILSNRISRSPDEVEISLQGQDESECWHGDLHEAEASEDDLRSYSSAPSNIPSESEYDSGAESTQSAYDYDSSNDASTTPTAPVSRPSTSYPLNRHHRQDYREPRGAVELKPYKHQVGGHSTVYRFSRRAVCKVLNNKENVFYETVERYHPELLEFLPR